MAAVPQTIPSAASPEIVENANWEAASWLGCYAHFEGGDGGLIRGYSGGQWGGFTVSDVNHTFGASTTTYVSAKLADGTFDFSTSNTNFNDTTNYKRVETVVTSGSVVTGTTDYRGGPGGVHGSGGGAGGGSSRTPSVQAVTSSATVTPTFSDDLVKITAQAAGLTLANPSGSAIEGIGIVIRIKDNGTARSISYGTQYRALGITLPTTTVISKTLYLACIWNDTDTKLDVVAVGQEA